MGLKLIEYAWDGSKFVQTGTLEFSPNPRSIEKSCKVQWRARHIGLYAIYPKCKYRYRREVKFTLKGECNGAKRKEIEFYAMRRSKFLIDNDSWDAMVSPEYYSDRNNNPADHPWQGTSHPNQEIYVMFESVTFTAKEGQKDWFTYTIKLTVVNDQGIYTGGGGAVA